MVGIREQDLDGGAFLSREHWMCCHLSCVGCEHMFDLSQPKGLTEILLKAVSTLGLAIESSFAYDLLSMSLKSFSLEAMIILLESN